LLYNLNMVGIRHHDRLQLPPPCAVRSDGSYL
jgi:hypothetical protein